VEWGQWAVEDFDTLKRQWSCRRLVDFVKDCSWSRRNCWRVNEYWTVDITATEFLIQTLSAAFGTKSLLELGGDDLNFIWILKLTVLKFVIIRKFLEILKFIKFEFSSYGGDASCGKISLNVGFSRKKKQSWNIGISVKENVYYSEWSWSNLCLITKR